MDLLSHSGDIRDQSRRLYKIDRNFACFWPPIFLGGAPPEFLESIYKIDTGSDHVAKFRGDRPRELGDYALKKKIKKNITGKTEDLPYYRTGRSKYVFQILVSQILPSTARTSTHTSKRHCANMIIWGMEVRDKCYIVVQKKKLSKAERPARYSLRISLLPGCLFLNYTT